MPPPPSSSPPLVRERAAAAAAAAIAIAAAAAAGVYAQVGRRLIWSVCTAEVDNKYQLFSKCREIKKICGIYRLHVYNK